MNNHLTKQLIICTLIALASCTKEEKQEKRVVAFVTDDGYMDTLPSAAGKQRASTNGSVSLYAPVQTTSSGKVKAYRSWLTLEEKQSGASPWVASDTLVGSWEGIFVAGQRGLRFVKLDIPDDAKKYLSANLQTTVVTQRWTGIPKGTKVTAPSGPSEIIADLASFQITLEIKSTQRADSVYPVFFLASEDTLIARMRVRSGPAKTNVSGVVTLDIPRNGTVDIELESPMQILSSLQIPAPTKVLHMPRGLEFQVPPLPPEKTLFAR